MGHHLQAMVHDNAQAVPSTRSFNIFVTPEPDDYDITYAPPSSQGTRTLRSDHSAERSYYVEPRALVSCIRGLAPDHVIVHSGCIHSVWSSLLELPNATLVCWGAELVRSNGVRGLALEVLKHITIPNLRVVCLSKGDERRLVQQYGSPKVLRTIPYYTPDVLLFTDLQPNGGEIRVQVGNDASPINDHVACLRALDRIRPTVVLPMGYGRFSDEYIKSVEASAAAFRSEFVHDLLPLASFNRLVASCDAFVVGSYEQRALGSVYRYLLAGRPVFLPRRAVLLADLTERGFSVNALEDLADMSSSEFTDLCRTPNRPNQQVGLALLGRDGIREAWSALLASDRTRALRVEPRQR